MNTDFYNSFFSQFGISKAVFIQYGISEIIFPDKDKAYDDWKQKKEDFLRKRNGNFYIRSDKGERWSKAYNDIFEGLSVNIDKTKNSKPTRLLEIATNIPKKGTPYTCAHIFGKTCNFMLFSALFNICYIPDLYAPFSDAICKKSVVHEHFRKMLLEKVKIEFGDIISEYNSFIRKHCIHKIEDYISKILKFDNLSRSDKRFIKDFRKQWEEIEV